MSGRVRRTRALPPRTGGEAGAGAKTATPLDAEGKWMDGVLDDYGEQGQAFITSSWWVEMHTPKGTGTQQLSPMTSKPSSMTPTLAVGRRL